MSERPHEQIAAVLSRDYPLYTLDVLDRLGWGRGSIEITRLKAILWEMIEEGTVIWHEQGGVVLRGGKR